MLKYLLIFLPIISVCLSQVAPNYQPYSLIRPDIELSITQLTLGDEEIKIKSYDRLLIKTQKLFSGIRSCQNLMLEKY